MESFNRVAFRRKQRSLDATQRREAGEGSFILIVGNSLMIRCRIQSQSYSERFISQLLFILCDLSGSFLSNFLNIQYFIIETTRSIKYSLMCSYVVTQCCDFFSCHIAVMCFPQSCWVSVEWPGRETLGTPPLQPRVYTPLLKCWLISRYEGFKRQDPTCCVTICRLEGMFFFFFQITRLNKNQQAVM